MNIAQNLQYLRKRDKITQEALADKLDVSRQSVSKWETGEAYPETDKLLIISDLFGVSLDGLMRDDLAHAQAEDPRPAAATDDGIIAKEYFKHADKMSRGISIGVMLILLGVAVCVALAGVAFTLSARYAELTQIMGGAAVIVFAAPAIFLFVFNGINHERFKKAHPVLNCACDENTAARFAKRFIVAMPLLISAILLDVIYLITMTALVQTDVIHVGNEDQVQCYITAAFLAAFAFIVGGLVYFGIQHGKYNTASYNERTRATLNPTKYEKIRDAICGAIMMLATALFFVLGFVFDYWSVCWVTFLVGGIMCGIVSVIFKAIDRND